MGSSFSKNISKTITQSIAKVSSDVISQTQLTSNQSQFITISDTDGDVVISGDNFTQKATINIQSLLDTLSKENVRQNLTYEIAQACKSVVSGLNLLQFPNAENEMNAFFKASAELINDVSQTCQASVSQSQSITVTRTKGSVFVVNDLTSQLSDILGTCVEKAVNNNSVFQQLKEKINQQATSEAKGLDLTQIIILILVILGVPVVSVIGGLTVVGRYTFPLSIVVGAGCLLLYNSWTDESMYSHAFSPLIRNYPNMCNSTILTSSTAYPDSTSASKACLNNRSCKAFDWMGTYGQTSTGNPAYLTPPQTIFYKTVGKACESSITNSTDNSPVFRRPVFIKGVGPPSKRQGDVYMDTVTTKYYFFDSALNVWKEQGSFAHSDFTSRNSIDWGTILPTQSTQAIAGSLYVYYDAGNPAFFSTYLKTPQGWKLYPGKLKGPGMIAAVPSKINVTGFTTIRHKEWLLYLGGSLLAIGLLGSVALISDRNSRKETARV
jgi:hypothetical protein